MIVGREERRCDPTEIALVLLNLAATGGFDLARWADRVQPVDAAYDGPWELPVIGTNPLPAAVLIGPDGYVAFAGELTREDGVRQGLADAPTAWFGEPAA